MQYLDLRKGDMIVGKTIKSLKLEPPRLVITFDDDTTKIANPFSVVRGVCRPLGGAR